MTAGVLVRQLAWRHKWSKHKGREQHESMRCSRWSSEEVREKATTRSRLPRFVYVSLPRRKIHAPTLHRMPLGKVRLAVTCATLSRIRPRPLHASCLSNWSAPAAMAESVGARRYNCINLSNYNVAVLGEPEVCRQTSAVSSQGSRARKSRPEIPCSLRDSMPAETRSIWLV